MPCWISYAASFSNALLAFTTPPRMSSIGNADGHTVKLNPLQRAECMASYSGMLLRFTTILLLAEVGAGCWASCSHWNLLQCLVLLSEETQELFLKVM